MRQISAGGGRKKIEKRPQFNNPASISIGQSITSLLNVFTNRMVGSLSPHSEKNVCNELPEKRECSEINGEKEKFYRTVDIGAKDNGGLHHIDSLRNPFPENVQLIPAYDR